MRTLAALLSPVAALTLAAATLASPAAAAPKPAAAAAATTTTTSTTTAKGPSKMKTCATQWKAMSKADQAKYGDKGKTMKSKKGNPLTGYQAWTSECMKKA